VRAPGRIDDHVVRLDVAVNDAAAVDVLEDVEQLLHPGTDLGLREPRRAQLPRQRAPLDERLAAEEAATHLEVAERLRDAAMVEAAEDLALAAEPIDLPPFFLRADVQHLHRHAQCPAVLAEQTSKRARDTGLARLDEREAPVYPERLVAAFTAITVRRPRRKARRTNRERIFHAHNCSQRSPERRAAPPAMRRYTNRERSLRIRDPCFDCRRATAVADQPLLIM
jgi:hypothetical protein